MNEAPTPLFSEKIIIKEEKTFKKDNFIINIGKSEINSQIIIKIVYPNEINVAKKIFSFDDFIKLIKPLKINENVDELYLNLIELFNKNEFSIKENEEKLEILINIYNNQGIKENYSIFFDEKEKDNEHIQKNIIKKIMQLEKDNKLLKDENKKLSEELNNLKKQIEGINKILFKNINSIIIENSHIIKNIQDFHFNFDKIEQTSYKKIKSLDLLYRASDNNGSGKIFHEKCNGKTPTLTIIHTKNDYIFGGYTEKNWSQFTNDDNAFCYSINLKKIYPIIKGKKAIGGGNEYGPIFYGDDYNFIQIGKNVFLDSESHSCNKKSNYEGVEKDFEISGGIEFFSVYDYEVFKINFI